MSWLVTAKQYIPAVIGEEFGGGYFAGYISHTADGNPTHALIVAPRGGVEPGATGTGYTLTTSYKWADQDVAVPASSTLIGASSTFDGKVNTDLMMSLIAAGTYSAGAFPAAQFCADLSIGGFTDWYFPARFELDIAYFNLKPSTGTNTISGTTGVNDYSVPKRTANYTLMYPAQTYASAFIATSGAEAFEAGLHWSSTEINSTQASRFDYLSGTQAGSAKTAGTLRVRAFRRIPL
jgi:hypothetical protein